MTMTGDTPDTSLTSSTDSSGAPLADEKTLLDKQKQAIRRMVRDRRNSLTQEQQHLAGLALAHHLVADPLYRRAKRIALFLSSDGEIDTQPLIELALASNKSVYLPVLDPLVGTQMHFQHFDEDTPLVNNRFGIAEPAFNPTDRLRPQQLNLVFMPLVAFDHAGHRLGMGGGFYDRAFAFLKQGSWQVPLVGLAHHCQQVEHVPTGSWDIPLAAIATDQGIFRFNK
ncbi:5-formyltetrahydrofolate cyclo-ligase [Pokkaliibacter sp. CJK22405]|uniref:5-formyltetrahydrofolate cyclo-ligase n=1 Tax=Pokkaliibacter sp. CJK22405 TaxID=3384615 RepID=UPI0039849EB4